MLAAWEVDTFCILLEDTINGILTLSTAVQPAYCSTGVEPELYGRPHCKDWQWPVCPKVVEPERTVGVGWICLLQDPPPLTVSSFSLSQGSVVTCLISLVRGLTALDSLVLSFMYLLLGKYLNYQVRCFIEMKRVLKLLSVFTMII